MKKENIEEENNKLILFQANSSVTKTASSTSLLCLLTTRLMTPLSPLKSNEVTKPTSCFSELWNVKFASFAAFSLKTIRAPCCVCKVFTCSPGKRAWALARPRVRQISKIPAEASSNYRKIREQHIALVGNITSLSFSV